MGDKADGEHMSLNEIRRKGKDMTHSRQFPLDGSSCVFEIRAAGGEKGKGCDSNYDSAQAQPQDGLTVKNERNHDGHD
jgi:hypothetical protein